MSISQRYPCAVSCFVPWINPLANRRLTVWVDMCRASAASLIDTRMVASLPGWVTNRVPGGYAVFNRFQSGILITSYQLEPRTTARLEGSRDLKFDRRRRISPEKYEAVIESRPE